MLAGRFLESASSWVFQKQRPGALPIRLSHVLGVHAVRCFVHQKKKHIIDALEACAENRRLPFLDRLLYTAVVRPAITTGCPAWWAPPDTPFFRKGVGEELQKAEN